jgi:hypothetical protein
MVQCKINRQDNQQDNATEQDTIKGSLVGNPLATVEEKEIELGIKFYFHTIESCSFDIDNNGKDDEIRIERIENWNDPGDFHRIRIIKQSGSYEFFNVHGWVEIGDYEVQHDTSFVLSNLVDSKYIVMKRASDTTKDIMIFAFGYVYASQPGVLSIIYASPEIIMPRLILNSNRYLYDFKDLNSDGNKDIIITIFDKEKIKGMEDGLISYELIDGWLQLVE